MKPFCGILTLFSYIGTDCSRLEEAIGQALALEQPIYGVFDKTVFDDLQTLQ